MVSYTFFCHILLSLLVTLFFNDSGEAEVTSLIPPLNKSPPAPEYRSLWGQIISSLYPSRRPTQNQPRPPPTSSGPDLDPAPAPAPAPATAPSLTPEQGPGQAQAPHASAPNLPPARAPGPAPTSAAASRPATNNRPAPRPSKNTSPSPDCGTGLIVTKNTENATEQLFRVLGGNETIVPWQVLFRPKHVNMTQCGGSVINEKWILTAAHCSFEARDTEAFVGITRRPRKGENGMLLQKIIRHKSYTESNHNYDYSLVQLQQKMKYNNLLKPVCLPRRHEQFTNQIGIASGWGHTKSEEGPIPDHVLAARMKIFSSDKCEGQLLSDEGYKADPSRICGGDPRLKSELCHGDSGGPLVVKGRDNRYHLAGVVSAAYAGCGKPVIFANVPHVIDWILQIAFRG